MAVKKDIILNDSLGTITTLRLVLMLLKGWSYWLGGIRCEDLIIKMIGDIFESRLTNNTLYAPNMGGHDVYLKRTISSL